MTNKEAKINNRIRIPQSFIGFVTALIVLSVPFANAQNNEADNAEVYDLSPFEINVADDRGYLATNTLDGSRMNTALRDTPAAITVFTREFLDDIGATNVEDLLLYDVNSVPDLGGAGFDGNGNQQGSISDGFSYRSRGLGGSVATDGFRTVGFGDNYNVERIGASRGPNAILFGVGSAGGTINLRTKRANTGVAINDLEFKVGTDDIYRGVFDINRVVIEDKLALRVIGVYDHKGSHRPHIYKKTQGLTLAGTYRFSENSTLNISYANTEIEGVGARRFGTVDTVSQFQFLEQAGQLVWDPDQGRYETLEGANAGGAQGVGNANRRGVIVYNPNFSTKGYIEGTASNSNYSSRITNSSFYNVSNANDNPSSLELLGIPLGSETGTGFTEFGEDDQSVLTIAFQQKLLEGMYLELSYNDSNRQTDGILGGNPRLAGDLTKTLPDGTDNPYWYGNGYYFLENHHIRLAREYDNETLRAALSYETDLGERWGSHRFALMFERNTAYELRDRDREVWAGAPYGGNPDAGNNRVRRRHYFRLDGPKDQIALGGNRDMRTMVETYNSAHLGDLTTSWTAANNRDAGDTVTTDSAMFVMQNYFFDRRLVTTLGYREDDLDIRGPLVIRDPSDRAWRFATPDDDPSVIAQYNSGRENWEVASKEQADFLTTGFVFHLNDIFSLTANASEGAQLPDRNRTVLPDDLVANPFDGQGVDYGIAFSFLENRISGSLKYFESETLRQSSGGNLAQTVFVNPNNDILQSFQFYFEEQGITDLSGANLSPVQGNAVTATGDLTSFLESGADAYLFDNSSDGYEFELLANVTDSWIVRFNYSYTANSRTNVLLEGEPWWAERRGLFDELDNYYVSQTGDGSVFDKLLVDEDGVSGNNPVSDRILDSDRELALNRAEQENGFGVRPHKANLWTRYSISEGKLKGFTIGGGYRYQDGNVAGINLDTGAKLIGNDTSLFDFMSSYRTKGFFGFGDQQTTYQVNISNLLDANTLVASKMFRDTVTGEPYNKRVYRLDPRQVTFTVRLSF